MAGSTSAITDEIMRQCFSVYIKLFQFAYYINRIRQLRCKQVSATKVKRIQFQIERKASTKQLIG